MGFFKSYHYTPTTRSARPLLPFPPLALVMDAKTDAKSFTPYFILSKKLQKSRLSLRTSGFLVRPMRFERTAFGVGVQRSIQLSYGRGYGMYYSIFPAICKASVSSFYCGSYTFLQIPFFPGIMLSMQAGFGHFSRLFR